MHRERQKQCSLLIRNLSKYAKTEDVRYAAEKYGAVRDVYLPMDYYTKQPRGIGFVEFYNVEDAEDCQRGLDGKVIEGLEIKVVFAERGRKRPEDYTKGRDRYGDRDRDRGNDRRDRDYDRRDRDRDYDRRDRDRDYDRRDRDQDRRDRGDDGRDRDYDRRDRDYDRHDRSYERPRSRERRSPSPRRYSRERSPPRRSPPPRREEPEYRDASNRDEDRDVRDVRPRRSEDRDYGRNDEPPRRDDDDVRMASMDDDRDGMRRDD